MTLFSPVTAEFLQHYAHDQAFRWSAEDRTAQTHFVEKALSNVAWTDWSDPALGLPLLQAAMFGTPSGLKHGCDGLLLAGPLTELLPAETLLALAQSHLNPAARLAGIVPCLRDNSPESQHFMDLAAQQLWPYHTAEEWLEFLGEAGFEAANIKAEFVGIPQFAASALTDKLRFGPFREIFRAVESAGYGAHEVGWGELRFTAHAPA